MPVLAYPEPTAQAILLKKFCDHNCSAKTPKVFHRVRQFAIYGIQLSHQTVVSSSTYYTRSDYSLHAW